MTDDLMRVVRRSILAAVVLARLVSAQDDCATALPITVGLTPGSTALLVTSTVASCGTLHRDIWYAWIATCNGVATASLCAPGSATFDTILAAYDGSGGCSNLLPVACNDNWCSTRSEVTFPVTLGGTYYLALGGATAGAAGAFTLSLSCASTVPNDECTSAFPITNGITVGSNIGATNSLQTGSCGSMGSDVWYSYTAPCSGVAEATFCQPGSATFDTVIAAFAATGSCANLSEIACNDDTCLLSSKVLFPVVAGNVYLLAVGGFSALQGTFALSLTCHQPPAGDDCAGALPLGLGTNGPFSNQFATDGVAPSSACPAGSGDLWFSFAPACSGLYRISTCGGGYDTVVSVLSGCAGPEIACNDNDPSGGCGAGSVVDVNATTGANYLVRVAGATAVRGSFNVTVSRLFLLTYGSPFGQGSLGFSVGGGVPSGVYYAAITFNAGQFPNGAFFGLDISTSEINDEIAFGYPFVGPLDACGDASVPGIVEPSLSGLTLFSVAVATDTTLTAPLISSPPVSYTVP